jgi:oligoribonuclease (3'-5' exoribonuclease)
MDHRDQAVKVAAMTLDRHDNLAQQAHDNNMQQSMQAYDAMENEIERQHKFSTLIQQQQHEAEQNDADRQATPDAAAEDNTDLGE